MVSSYTTNKNLEKPGNGDYVDTWNVPVNADMDAIDQAFGGVTSFNATAGSAVLTDTQYRSLILLVSGAMSANVTYTIPSGVGGQWIVRNTTTDSSGGPWTVTFDSGGGGTSYVVPRNTSTIIFSDGTNIRTAPVVPEAIPSGTIMLFVQTAAPTGWTKSTTHDNKALRVVSGAASSGGTTAFTSVFTSRTITTSNMPSHSHGVNDPGHSHGITYVVPNSGAGPGWAGGNSYAPTTYGYSTSSAGTGISIQNAGSGTPMDFAVQYVDVIIATKD